MSIEPVPFEPGRFYVKSDSRKNVLHLVDLAWQEESWQKPKPFCGCEESLAKGHICKHILATVNFEKTRLHL